jgi:hypothetical protein
MSSTEPSRQPWIGRSASFAGGRACSFPGGCVHTHENLHDDPARVLIMMTPGSIGRRYYEGVAQEVNVYGKPDFAKIEDISEPRSCAGLSAHSDSFPGRVYDGLCGAAAALPLRYRKRLPLATVQHMARSKMVKVSSWHWADLIPTSPVVRKADLHLIRSTLNFDPKAPFRCQAPIRT